MAINRKFSKSLGTKPSIQGKDIELTIDLNLQLVAEEVLKDKKAVTIAMDPRNGAIRAMSKLTFDLNFFKDLNLRKNIIIYLTLLKPYLIVH